MFRLFSIFTLLLLPILASPQQPVRQHTDEALMMRLFGNYDSKNEWSIWQPRDAPKEYEQYFENGRGRTSIELDQTVKVGAKEKHFVVLSTLADGGGFQGCHACAVLLSAMIFDGKSLNPQVRENFLMAYGQNGEAPKIFLRPLGRAHFAIEATDDYCMGGTCEGSLFLFGEVDGRLKQLLALRSDNDDSNLNICSKPSHEEAADCKADPPYCFGTTDAADDNYRENCTSWVGSLSVLAPRGKGWSDITFTQRVKAARPGTFTHRRYVTLFHFDGERYKAPPRLTAGPSIDINYYRK
jgi:hypothetical protein